MAINELLSSVLKRQQIQHLLTKLPTPICLSSGIWAVWVYVPGRYFLSSILTASALQLLVAAYLIKSLRKNLPNALSTAREIDTRLNTKERLTALISLKGTKGHEQLSTLLTQQLEPIVTGVKPAEVIRLQISPINIAQLILSAFLTFICINQAISPNLNSSQINLINSIVNQHQLPEQLAESLNELVETLKHEELSSNEVSAALKAAESALTLAENEALKGGRDHEQYITGDTSKNSAPQLDADKNNPNLQQPTSTPTPTALPKKVPDTNSDQRDEKQDKDEVDIQHSKSAKKEGSESGSSGGGNSDQGESNHDNSSQDSRGDSQQKKQNQQGQQQQDGTKGQDQGSESSSGQESQDKSSQSSKGSNGSDEGKDGKDGNQQSDRSGEEKGGNSSGGQADSQGEQEQSASSQSSESDSNSSSNNGTNPALNQVKQGLEAIKEAQNKAADQGQKEGAEQGQKQNDQQKPNQQSGKNGSSQGDNKGNSEDPNSGQSSSERKESETREPGNKGQGQKGSQKNGSSSKDSSPANGKEDQSSSQPDEKDNQKADKQPEQSSSKKSASKQEGSGGMALPSEQSETKEGLPEDGDGPAQPQRPPQFKEKQIGEAQESYDLSATGSEQGRIINRNEAEYRRSLKDLSLSKPAERKDSQPQKVPLEYRNWLN